jgi:glutaredoxin
MDAARRLRRGMFALATGALLAACDPMEIFDLVSGPLAMKPENSELLSLDGEEAMQIYYQFTDAKGRVRFVTSLEAVPESWRDRVGFVELSSPPPLTPEDMRRVQEARLNRLQVRRQQDHSSPEIIIYSADWCGACRAAKRYMDSEGIEYTERNVDEPRWQEEMFAKAGPGGIPVIDVEGNLMRGFNKARLQALLEQAS